MATKRIKNILATGFFTLIVGLAVAGFAVSVLAEGLTWRDARNRYVGSTINQCINEAYYGKTMERWDSKTVKRLGRCTAKYGVSVKVQDVLESYGDGIEPEELQGETGLDVYTGETGRRAPKRPEQPHYETDYDDTFTLTPQGQAMLEERLRAGYPPEISTAIQNGADSKVESGKKAGNQDKKKKEERDQGRSRVYIRPEGQGEQQPGRIFNNIR